MGGRLEPAVDLDQHAPAPVQFIDFDFDTPRFLVTVDTEEEFNWNGPFTRDGHGTQHVSAIDRFQQLCDSHDVKPAYLVDYPITRDDAAAALLGGYVQSGRADVGVQLHPWVNPPFEEEVDTFNSYACNLPPALERAKLTALHSLICERFAVRPMIYRAGRYGAGHETRQILHDLGVAIDTSVRSLFDYSAHGGPNYGKCPLDPYWIYEGKLLELPVTSVFDGPMRGAGKTLFTQVFKSPAARGLLARTGMLERIALTPEGIPAEKAVRAIDLALALRVPILNFSFHSPSLAVGFTPYVRNEADLDAFYRWWEIVFAHLAQRGVQPICVKQIYRGAGIEA